MTLPQTSIKRRLKLVILMASLTVLLFTSAAFIIYEIVASSQELERNVQMAARMLADQATVSLIYESPSDAADVLSSLKSVDNITAAALYDTNGTLFAFYPTNSSRKLFPERPPQVRRRFTSTDLTWSEPVVQAGKRAGTLAVTSDLSPIYERLRLYTLIGTLVAAVSFLVALSLSNYLQKSISQPILNLAQTARVISERRDYSVRAQQGSNDELGLLTDAFNHMLGQIQDRESALRASAERLRLALQAAQIGTWDWHIRSNRLEWDEYVQRQFGLEPGQLQPTYQAFLQRIHPDDQAWVKRTIQDAVEGRAEFNVEFRVLWPDSTLHYLVARGKAVCDENGRAARMTGVSLDITERKKSEEARALLAAIVESSDDAIIGKDLQGRVISWNAGAQRMFGYTPQEIVGQPVTIITAHDRPEEERDILRRIQEGSAVEHYETARIRKDGGQVLVSLSVSPIRDAKGQIAGVSSIARDITARKQAEDEIRRLNAELEQRVEERTAKLTEANQELEAFTYSVSHDLRAPLRHIDAFARIVDEEMSSQTTPELRNYVARIRRGTQTMGRLVDDLLNLSRVGRAQMGWQSTDLNALVDEVVADLRSENPGRQIDWRLGPLPSADCDPGLIKQVFANLLSNAVKYTRPREKAIIEVGCTASDGQNVIFVRDNGVGFNMKYVGKLFGVFERLHRPDEFEGTGIGLATVRRIIQKHDGRVWAEAEPDKGATFYFTLQGMKPENEPLPTST